MWQHITSLLFLLAVAFSVVCWNGFAMESAHNVTSSSPTNTVQQITHLTESNNRLQYQIADLRQDIEQLKQQVTQLNKAPLEPQQALGDTSGTTAHEAPPSPSPRTHWITPIQSWKHGLPKTLLILTGQASLRRKSAIA